MLERRVGGRRLGQAGEQGGLGQTELGDRLAEEGAGGRLHPEGAVAEVDLIQVHLDDPVLRVAPLELEGEHRLLELALEALVRGEEEHLGELLGDGAAALHDAPAPEVLVDRARDAGRIHPVVGVEACVLGGDDGLAQRLGDLGERHEDAALDVELGDQLVVVVVDLGALARRRSVSSWATDGREPGRMVSTQNAEAATPRHAHEDHHQSRHERSSGPTGRRRSAARFLGLPPWIAIIQA